MNATVVGASGYSGRELVSLLLNHPKVNLVRVTSRALQGENIESHIPLLRGKGKGLTFSNPSINELANDQNCEIYFLALPHGTSSTYAIPLLEAGKKVIDLSADFRLNSTECYEEFYNTPTPHLFGLQKPLMDYLRFMIFHGITPT